MNTTTLETCELVCPICGRYGTLTERKYTIEYDKVMRIERDTESNETHYIVENKGRYTDENYTSEYNLECNYCGAEWGTVQSYVEDVEQYNAEKSQKPEE